MLPCSDSFKIFKSISRGLPNLREYYYLKFHLPHPTDDASVFIFMLHMIHIIFHFHADLWLARSRKDLFTKFYRRVSHCSYRHIRFQRITVSQALYHEILRIKLDRAQVKKLQTNFRFFSNKYIEVDIPMTNLMTDLQKYHWMELCHCWVDKKHVFPIQEQTRQNSNKFS